MMIFLPTLHHRLYDALLPASDASNCCDAWWLLVLSHSAISPLARRLASLLTTPCYWTVHRRSTKSTMT
jgi:hypothetical protein